MMDCREAAIGVLHTASRQMGTEGVGCILTWCAHLRPQALLETLTKYAALKARHTRGKR